ncbi:MAG: iron complex transport system substrate-binding protein [Gammaproteobacteria bacterium]|jgi:iron complex transport system substrate-binding protein
MRIVSTTCSNTEIVCALGCERYLVGVDNHSDFPIDVVSCLPRVGPDLQVDAEVISSLQPDLVLASLTVPGHEKVIDALKNAGLPYWASAPESLEAVYNDIENIAQQLGVASRGTQLIDEMRQQLKPVEHNGVQIPSIAVQWWPKPPIIAARKSWVHDIIELAGGRNALEAFDEISCPLELEQFADLNPDIIVISWCGVKEEKYRSSVISDNPILSSVSAVRNKRIVPISEAYLGRPSVRLVEGYRLLKTAVDKFHQEAGL